MDIIIKCNFFPLVVGVYCYQLHGVSEFFLLCFLLLCGNECCDYSDLNFNHRLRVGGWKVFWFIHNYQEDPHHGLTSMLSFIVFDKGHLREIKS